jgi:hypothetical protein
MNRWVSSYLSRTMHQRMHPAASPAAQCFLLQPHAQHRLPALSMLPPRVPSTQRHGSDLFMDDLSILLQSHAHPARGEFRRLCIYRQVGRIKARLRLLFENLPPLFQLPLDFSVFSSTPVPPLFCLLGKHNRPCGLGGSLITRMNVTRVSSDS